MLEELQQNLHCAQLKMKAKADEHSCEVSFDVGELVYFNLRPYRRRSLAVKANEKLEPKFYGPFEIEAWVGMVAYQLKLPADTKIHPVFHVSQLRKVVGDHHTVTALPIQLSEDLELCLALSLVRWGP